MKIIFVRHGEPDYAADTLTELGNVQAKATAARLADFKISEVHSSTMGRAYQTAKYTADSLGLEVVQHEFMRELNWGASSGEEIPFGGHPWNALPDMIARGKRICTDAWRDESEFVVNDKLIANTNRVANGFDEWLRTFGYEREGDYYRVAQNPSYKTVAFFAHHGAMSTAISHIFNIPFPQLCAILGMGFCAISVIHLPEKAGTLVMPKIALLSDNSHVPSKEAMLVIEK